MLWWSTRRASYGPSTGDTVAVYTERMGPRPGGHLGRRCPTAFPADELHQLEYWASGLARTALLAPNGPGHDRLAPSERALRQRCSGLHPITRRGVGCLAHGHRAERSLPRHADDGDAAASAGRERPDDPIPLWLVAPARDLPLLVSHRRKYGDPPDARAHGAAGFCGRPRRRGALSTGIKMPHRRAPMRHEVRCGKLRLTLHCPIVGVVVLHRWIGIG